jgi:hypothetical protein
MHSHLSEGGGEPTPATTRDCFQRRRATPKSGNSRTNAPP